MSPLSKPQVSSGNQAYQNALSQIKLATENEPVLRELKHLVGVDGAGSWPPRATHRDTWPAALRSYHDIYLEIMPYLATEDVITDNEINTERRDSFRERVRTALCERVDLPIVKDILCASENKDNCEGILSPASYNGFSACIATMRHVYRWGVIPVVKVAQQEKIIDFPEELNLPWPYICRRYGVTSKGGNVMTNYFCNFDEQERIVYEINGALSDLIRTAEYNFLHIFVVVERLALPIYHEMAKSITHYTRGNKEACLTSLKAIVEQLPGLLRVFYKTLVEAQISPKVWMRYVQGPSGWGAGEMINGEYVEYDGLSGSHTPFFRVADAFLGLSPYFSEENMRRYIPESQRKLCQAIQEHGFREKAKEAGDDLIGIEIENMLKQLRLFRATHRARIHKYLGVTAPERLIMTAGRSVLESEEIPEIDTAIKHLDGILEKRLKMTN